MIDSRARRLSLGALVLTAALASACGQATLWQANQTTDFTALKQAKGPGWYAVQLHAHSTYSDGKFTPKELIRQAKAEGLDALGLSDHDMTEQWLDPDVVAEKQLLMLRSQEAMPPDRHNHMGIHGMKGITPLVRQDREAMLAEATRRDATVLIHHPSNRLFPWSPLSFDRRVHGIEVWNAWSMSPLTTPAKNSHEHGQTTEKEAWSANERSIAWWSSLLGQGERIAAIASADFHESPKTVGIASPCTLVYAESLSERAIMQGIRQGRTLLVSHPTGPRVLLDADANGDGTFEALPGELVPAGAKVRVRVLKGQGLTMRLMGDGAEVLRQRVPSAEWQTELTLPKPARFVFARIDQRTPLGPRLRAMTSAVYMQAP